MAKKAAKKLSPKRRAGKRQLRFKASPELVEKLQEFEHEGQAYYAEEATVSDEDRRLLDRQIAVRDRLVAPPWAPQAQAQQPQAQQPQAPQPQAQQPQAPQPQAQQPQAQQPSETAAKKSATNAPITREATKRVFARLRDETPQQKGETASAYANRLHERLENIVTTSAWTQNTCRRELYRKAREDFAPDPRDLLTERPPQVPPKKT
jgi:hypothetical protein